MHSKIISSGVYLPLKKLSNLEISELVDTSNEWIFERTGIKNRFIAADEEYTSDLAAHSLRASLHEANLNPNDIDGIILATTTPDLILPSTATIVQNKIGITNGGFAFDVAAVCSGFLHAITIADALLKNTQHYKRIAVIGAETMSRIVNWNDRSTCVLFGDGAGTVILEKSDEGQSRILDSILASDGSLNDILIAEGGISKVMNESKLVMKGKEVFRHAVEKMCLSSTQLLMRNNLSVEDINWVVPHQANVRIMDAISKKLNIPSQKIVSTIEEQANTSAASIPLALNKLLLSGKAKRGDLILFTAAGAGFTWGSMICYL